MQQFKACPKFAYSLFILCMYIFIYHPEFVIQILFLTGTLPLTLIFYALVFYISVFEGVEVGCLDFKHNA